MQNCLFLLTCILFLSCSQPQQSKPIRVFNEVDSLSISNITIYDKKKLPLLPKVIAADSNIKNKQIMGWSIENKLSIPTKIVILSRSLSDFDLTFYVLDTNRNVVETKRLYWGMPSNEREENSYLPIKSTFIDSNQRLEILVIIDKSFRKVVNPVFEINTSRIENEYFFRKIIDSILTAFLMTNLVFSVWLFKNNRQLGNVLKFYFLYNLFILSFFFFRYFLSYINNFNLPIIINYTINVFSHSAYYCYYYFGQNFIDKNYKATKTERTLILISLLTFLSPSVAFLQTTLIIRMIIVLFFLFNLYKTIFLHRHKKQTHLFFFISLPLLLFGGINGVYGILNTDLNLKYVLELSKISIIIESIMLFGGLIIRNNTSQNLA